jgi:hypothetical protein
MNFLRMIKESIVIITFVNYVQVGLHVERKIMGIISNMSTTDHIFYICQMHKKKWKYNVAVHQLFIDFKKACDSVMWDVLYNVLIYIVYYPQETGKANKNAS